MQSMRRPTIEASDGLLERERELARLRDEIARASEGEGRMLVVEAPAGLGKTHLLRAGSQAARDAGFQVLSARGGELERDFSWGIVRSLFERIAVADGFEGAFAGAAAHARRLLAEDVGASRETAPDVAMHGLYWLVANLAERRPLLLVVDDAHWTDPASLGFLGYLARRLEGLRVMLLLATRPTEGVAAEMTALSRETTRAPLRPAPLRLPAVRALVTRRFPGEPDADFVRACRGATGGNPFLLTLLLEVIAATRLPPVAASLRRAGTVGAQEILGWLLSRLSSHEYAVTAVANAITVLGSDAEPRHAAELAGVDDTAATRIIDDLVRAGFLEREPPLRFVHPLIRAAVHDALLPGRRAELHARAARALVSVAGRPDRVAAHLLATTAAGDAWTVQQLRTAAADAMARGDSAAAVRYLQRAVVEPPPSDLCGDILFELGSAEAAASHPAAVGHLREAVALADNPVVAGERALALAAPTVFAGAGDEAVASLQRATDALGTMHPQLTAQLRAMLFIATLEQGLMSGAQSLLGDLRRRELELGDDPASRVLAGARAAFAGQLGDPADETAALAERAIAGGRMLEEHPPASLFVVITLHALHFSGRYERAHELYTHILEQAREAGSSSAYAIASTFRALAALRLGRLVDASADAAAATAITSEGRLPVIADHAVAFQAIALVARGELSEAEQVLQQVAESDGDGGAQAFLSFARGSVAAARGDHRAAARQMLRAGDKWRRFAVNPSILPWRSGAAISLAATGERQRALALAEEDLELARRLGSNATIGAAQRTCALVRDDAETVDLLAAAVARLADSPARLDYALALVDHGTALIRSGRTEEGREPLSLGLDVATRCGAGPLAERAHAELRAAGARPRRPYKSGRHALTPSELRVAELAADGMSNRDIAQALFVTIKTVELHLSRAYRKLEIRSRSSLPTALATQQ